MADSFCKKFLATYKSLTDDRAIDKNEIFYAHAVYQPTFVRKKVTSSYNGQSSFAVITDGFVEPTKDNFASLIIKNGSDISLKIKQLIETTKPWLKTEVERGLRSESISALDNSSLLETNKTALSGNRLVESLSPDTQQVEVSNNNGFQAGLTPQPLKF